MLFSDNPACLSLLCAPLSRLMLTRAVPGGVTELIRCPRDLSPRHPRRLTAARLGVPLGACSLVRNIEYNTACLSGSHACERPHLDVFRVVCGQTWSPFRSSS